MVLQILPHHLLFKDFSIDKANTRRTTHVFSNAFNVRTYKNTGSRTTDFSFKIQTN